MSDDSDKRRLRMDAYYYEFDPTGCAEVDEVLSAVAWAGKMYHHTDQWTDDDFSEVDRIQAAANNCAAALSAAESARATAEARLAEATAERDEWRGEAADTLAKLELAVRLKHAMAAERDEALRALMTAVRRAEFAEAEAEQYGIALREARAERDEARAREVAAVRELDAALLHRADRAAEIERWAVQLRRAEGERREARRERDEARAGAAAAEAVARRAEAERDEAIERRRTYARSLSAALDEVARLREALADAASALRTVARGRGAALAAVLRGIAGRLAAGTRETAPAPLAAIAPECAACEAATCPEEAPDCDLCGGPEPQRWLRRGGVRGRGLTRPRAGAGTAGGEGGDVSDTAEARAGKRRAASERLSRYIEGAGRSPCDPLAVLSFGMHDAEAYRCALASALLSLWEGTADAAADTQRRRIAAVLGIFHEWLR